MASIKQYIEVLYDDLNKKVLSKNYNEDEVQNLYKDCVTKVRSAIKVTKRAPTKQYYLSTLIKLYSLRDKYLRKRKSK